MEDKRKNNGGNKNAGRKPKNKGSHRITFTPSQQALDVYNSWERKSENLDQAIINHKTSN